MPECQSTSLASSSNTHLAMNFDILAKCLLASPTTSMRGSSCLRLMGKSSAIQHCISTCCGLRHIHLGHCKPASL